MKGKSINKNLKNQSNYLMTIIACIAVIFAAIFITSNLNMKGTYSGGHCEGVAAGESDCTAEGGVWVSDEPSGGGDDTPSGGGDDTPSGGGNDTPSGGGDDTPSGGGSSDHPSPSDDDWGDYIDCTGYWYNGSCHTTPQGGGSDTPSGGGDDTPSSGGACAATAGTPCMRSGQQGTVASDCSCVVSGGSGTPSGGDTPSCNVGGSCSSGGRYGTYLSDCSCYLGSDAGSSPADPTPGTSTPTVADCTFGTPSQNSAGGYFADVDCGPGGTSSLEEQACVSKGWSYRSGQCYYGGKIKFVGDDNEYAWTSPLGEGNCPPGYVWNASISMCLDRLCDCGQGDGDCEEETRTVTPGGSTPSGGGDYPVPVTPTPEDYVPESDRCFECTVGSGKSYVIAGSAAAARSSSGGTNCIVTFSSNCVKNLKCYECKVGSSNKYTKAYDSSEAATVTGGTNCTEKSMSACNPGSSTIDNPTTYCFACVTNGEYKYTKANDASEAASVTRGINCTIVSMNSCNTGENVIINPKTGTIAIVFAWIIGIVTIGYTFWYFKRTKTLNK